MIKEIIEDMVVEKAEENASKIGDDHIANTIQSLTVVKSGYISGVNIEKIAQFLDTQDTNRYINEINIDNMQNLEYDII